MKTQKELEDMSNDDLSNAIINMDPGRMSHSFDIDDWSDMGPLIQNNKIDIGWPEVWCAGFVKKPMQGGRSIFIQLNSAKYALRAAAIVYILIKQAKQQ